MIQEVSDFMIFNQLKEVEKPIDKNGDLKVLGISSPFEASRCEDLEDIEIRILGKRFCVKLEGFSKRAKEEIFQIFEGNEIEITELLRAYLSKVQETCTLNDELEELAKKIFLV